MCSRFSGRLARPVWMLVMLAIAAPMWAQPTTRRAGRERSSPNTFRGNPAILAAFKPVVAKASASVVRVLADGKEASLGVVVDAKGLILAKNSELSEAKAFTVTLRNGKSLEAKIVGSHDKCDLALLKVEATDLTPIEWAANAGAVGDLLAVPGVDGEPVAVGVLGVAARKVGYRDLPSAAPPANAGFLGVGLEETTGGAAVTSVVRGGPAEKAGLLIGDIIFQINDTHIIDTETLINTIQHHKPGDEVEIHYRRAEKEQVVKAKLVRRPPERGNERADFQNRMGSDLSKRRGGFPAILQHDMALRPVDCGGVVVGLDGKAIGINIARAGRTETYALPVDAVKAALDEIKSGKGAATAPATRPEKK